MLTLTNYEGNTKQNYSEILLPIINKIRNNKCREDVEKREPCRLLVAM